MYDRTWSDERYLDNSYRKSNNGVGGSIQASYDFKSQEILLE